MALPFDNTGAAATNKIVDELHAVGTLEQRYIIPDKGTFYVNRVKVFNDATGLLLEPVTDYMILQLSIDASNLSLLETSQIIFVMNPSVIKVRLHYQAVGSEQFENIHARVRGLVGDFISGKTSNRIFGAVAGESVELSPRDFLSTSRVLNNGHMLYVQLNNIAEAIATNDPSAVQAVYEFMINHTNTVRQEYTNKILQIRSRIDQVFKSTEIVNGQYLFTHEDLNPFVYLNYGKWQNNPNLLFWGGPKDNVQFGNLFSVSNEPGLFGMRTMAYRRDDSGTGIAFNLTANRNTINEGETVIFTLSAPGLSAGTRIPYIISGVQSSDVVGGSLTGWFLLNASGVGSVEVTMTEDEQTDGDANLVMRLQQSPDIYAVVLVKDTSQKVTYNAFFTSDENGTRVIQTADEGQTAFLQIRTTGLVADTVAWLLYNDSTINDDDIETKPGTVTIKNNRATVPYTFKNDFTTEGNETMVVNVCRTMNIASKVLRAIIQVNDTSKTPTMATLFTAASNSNNPISSINEGQQMFFKIKTTNMPNGSAVTLSYSGNAIAADFTNPLPTSVSLTNNEAVVILNVKADGITEGDETFTITTKLVDAPTVTDVRSIVIKDTSVGFTLDSVFYSNSSDGSQPITSGTIPTNIYLCVRTKGFNNGDQVHIDFDVSDPAVKALLTATAGLIRINANFGAMLITLDDVRGQYTQVGQLRARISTYINNTIGDQLGSAPNFVVNPRAVPTARLIAMDVNNNVVSQIGEGATLKIKIETVNIPNGAPALPVRHGGTATADDFNNVFPNAVVITNGVGWLEYSIKADGKLEGTESFIVTVELPYGGGTSSVQVSILDTSLPVANMRWTSDVSGNNNIQTVNEGATAYLQIRTSGFVDGTILQLKYGGSVSENDVVGGLPKTVAIVSGAAVVAYNFANDYIEEGDETLTAMLLYQGTDMNSNATIVIADTSVPGPTEIKWSRNLAPTAAVGNIVFSEGETAYLHIQTKGLVIGTELQMSYSGTAGAADFTGGLPPVVTVTGEWTTMTFPILEDYTEEPGANENLFATVTYRARSVATVSPMAIIDTSQYLSVKGGETKQFYLQPGETYYFIVQGAGGAGGRGIASTTKPTTGPNGDGGRGGHSTLVIPDILDIWAGGGGEGKGVPIYDSDAYGNLTHLYRAAPGGWTDVTLRKAESGSYTNLELAKAFTGMDGGNGMGPMTANELLINTAIPHNVYNSPGIALNFANTLPAAIKRDIFGRYGSGGQGGQGMSGKTIWGQTGFNPGTSGSAGGTWMGVLHNPTTTPLLLTMTAGLGGKVATGSTPLGSSGVDGQPGCIVGFRVRDKTYDPGTKSIFKIRNAEMAQPPSGWIGADWNDYPRIVIPVGKRCHVVARAAATVTPQDSLVVIGLALTKLNGEVIISSGNVKRNFIAESWRSGNPYGDYMANTDDPKGQGNVPGDYRYFKYVTTKIGWRGDKANTPPAFQAYTGGIGLSADRPIDPTRYGYQANGSNIAASASVNNADFPVDLLEQNDTYGRGPMTSATWREDGCTKVFACIENTTNSEMWISPYCSRQKVSAAQWNVEAIYTLEDI